MFTLQDVGPGVTVMAPVGHRLWAGTSQGCIRVLQPGGIFHQWRAYREPVIAICPCGSRVYTLSEDGALKGWSSDLPGPHLDSCRWPPRNFQLIDKSCHILACMVSARLQRPTAVYISCTHA